MSVFDDIRRRVLGPGINVQAALAELAEAEAAFWRGWGHAMFLRTSGALSRREWESFQRGRDALLAVRREVYESIRRPLATIGQEDRLPAPTDLPNVPPPAGVTLPPAEGSAENPVGAAGLGAAPLIVWAAAVAAVIVQLAAIYAIIRILQLGYDTAVRIYNARENTRRFELTVDSQQRRFTACLQSGGTPAHCAALFPTPEPHYEEPPPTPSDPLVWGIGIAAGVLSLGAVGYLFYEFASPGKLGEWRSYSSKPTRVRSADVPRMLRGRR